MPATTNMSDSHFDAIATVYDESLPSHVVEHYLRKRVAFLCAVCPGGRVLDVGCGTGALAERMTQRGYTVTGVDPSEGMLEVMRRRVPGATAIRASGTELPLPDDTFDLVFTVATLHHIAEPSAVAGTLGEMVRVTRPGGRVVIWDHNPRNPYWSVLMARVPQDIGDERLVSECEVMAGLMAAGARILSAQQLGMVPDFTPPGMVRAAAAVERWLEAVPRLSSLAAHNVIVAGKEAQPRRAAS
jgi:ubiquinone/menaquinone biosynthesis C-methylase UbiE